MVNNKIIAEEKKKCKIVKFERNFFKIKLIIKKKYCDCCTKSVVYEIVRKNGVADFHLGLKC